MKKWAKTFKRVEKTYGVQKEILTAIWGLETSFGHFMGNKKIFRSFGDARL